MGRWHARALSHCLLDLTLSIFRIGRKTMHRERERKEEWREENTSGLTSRELPGKGGQPEPRRYNDWLAGANSPSAALVAALTNSPLSLRVSVWSVNTQARTRTHSLRQAVRGSRAFERKGGHIWRISPCGCRR